jgi:hypothetical protein
MKSFLAASLLSTLIVGSAFGAWIEVAPSRETGIRLLSDQAGLTVIECDVAGFDASTVAIHGQSYQSLSLPGEPTFLEAGSPELPKLVASIILPDEGQPMVRVIEAEYTEIPMRVAPSKGNFTRDIHPDTVPYTFGKAYDEGTFPAKSASLNAPYILRDYRASAVNFQPFQYIASTHMLRVCTHMVVEVETMGAGGSNTITRAAAPQVIDASFDSVYKRHFLNYDQDRYTSIDESGSMLIICADEFMTEMAPFVEWKLQSGHTVEMQPLSAIGTNAAAIQAYVEDYYITPGLTYLLLVGDAEQMPSLSAAGGASDPGYAFLTGGDYYPEIFVGRFSGSTSAHISTQVERCVEYERNPQMGASWYAKGFGVASSEGAGNGDDGEADYQHMDNIRTDLLGYGFSTVDQLYATNGSTAANVSTALNNGRSVGDYCGHGSETQWVTTGFSNSHIDALTNDNMLPFIFDVACVNGKFTGITCFAEAWVRATHNGEPTGAVGIYAATINQSWAPPMAGQDEMIDLLVAEEKMTYGGLCFNGAMLMNDEYSDWDMMKTWTIFSDPSLLVRTKTPLALTVNHPAAILSSATSVAVQTGRPDATVTISADGELFGMGVTDAGGSVNVNFDLDLTVGQDLTVTVTGFNLGTYLGSLEVLPPSGPYVAYSAATLDGNGQLNPSESLVMDLRIENVGIEVATGLDLTLTTSNTAITLTDATESYGSLAAGADVNLLSAFAFDSDNSLSDGDVVAFDLLITDDASNSWESSFSFVAGAPLLSMTSFTVNDGDNGRLDPGEDAQIIASVRNDGSATATNLSGAFTGVDDFVEILLGADVVAAIAPGSTENFTFEVRASNDAPTGHVASFAFAVVADNALLNETIALTVGLTLEDFETGDFSSFDWTSGGNQAWGIDSDAYEGAHAAKSGSIGDNNTSRLILDLEVSASSDLSFFYKVSSESGYDYFRFFVDGSQLVEAAGEVAWTEFSTILGAGEHELIWEYSKDGSVSNGSDCAWVDFIIFPDIQPPLFPSMQIAPLAFDFVTAPGGSDVQALLIENVGQAPLNWSLDFSETDRAVQSRGKQLQTRSMEGSTMELDLTAFQAGESYVLNVTLNNGSTDDEWAVSAFLDFPEGVTVTAATNLTGGSAGDLTYEGATGNGAQVSWMDADGGYGNVYPGESATATVSISVAADFSVDMQVPWSITGDQWGADPHTVTGDFLLTNEGEVIPLWCVADLSSGSIEAGSSQTVQLTANAGDMPEGLYTGLLTIESNDPTTASLEIPVSFVVGGVTLDPVTDLSLSYVGFNAMLSWSAVEFALSYRIESSDDPYASTWNLEAQTSETYYTDPAGAISAKFYRVIAVSTQ